MKVTIITVSYNSAKTIQDTIDSIKSQDYNDIEYIVIDGASNDKTLDILKKHKDVISKMISEPDNGIYDAMNKGLKMATGDIIGILNSDDFYLNNDCITKIVDCFSKENCDIVYTNINYVNQDDTSKIVRKWRCSEYKKGAFRNGWHPAHPGFFVRKRLYDEYGNFDTNLRIAADFDIMYRFIEIFKSKSKFLDYTSVGMRIGGESNQSLINIFKGNNDVIKSFSKYGNPIPFYYPFLRLIPKIKQYF